MVHQSGGSDFRLLAASDVPTVHEARLAHGALRSGGGKTMRTFIAAAIVGVALAFASDPPPSSEAPAGFDDKSNGMV